MWTTNGTAMLSCGFELFVPVYGDFVVARVDLTYFPSLSCLTASFSLLFTALQPVLISVVFHVLFICKLLDRP